MDASTPSLPVWPSQHGGCANSDAPVQPSSKPHAGATLPDFIRPFFVQNPKDLDYLQNRDVFNLPDPRFQQLILDRYAEFVHPILPVIDYSTFHTVVTEEKPEPRISLLLYYAVMFAGVGAMEADLIMRQSYMSPKAVRELFYGKAQVRVCRDSLRS